MDRTITPRELQAQLDFVDILDIRRPHDYELSAEIIPGSRWLDPDRVATWLSDLRRDRDIVVYCVHGHSVSNSVVDRLREAGIPARYLEGGIEDWKAAGGETCPR
jgi:rhodanese-related sulfurtransferase